MIKRMAFYILSMTILFCFSPLSSDEDSSFLKLIHTVYPIPSPTGYEEPLVDVIKEILPASKKIRRDNLGSLYWEPGNRGSQLSICTPMDEVGYFVSGIDLAGYLRLDRAVSVPSLIDSYHLGHPVIVWTDSGPVKGVLAVPSLHILSPDVRKELQENPGLHLAFLDIGVGTDTEARDKGVGMLDAVTPWREITNLAGSQMAGYGLGLKSCLSLVLDLAKNSSESAQLNTSFVWMAQTKLPVRRSRPRASLGALRASQEVETRNIVVVDVFPCDAERESEVVVGNGPVLVFFKKSDTKVRERIQSLSRDMGLPLQLAPDYTSPVLNPFSANDNSFIGLLLPIKFAQTPSEIVDSKDIEVLHALLAALLGEGRI
jgi:putative aminopeptidase FrvX